MLSSISYDIYPSQFIVQRKSLAWYSDVNEIKWHHLEIMNSVVGSGGIYQSMDKYT